MGQQMTKAPGTDALRLLADLFSESAHETWTKEEIVNIIEDAIRLRELPQSPNEDPYITDLKFANEQNIKAARKYKGRLNYMEAKYGAIDWDAPVTRPLRHGEEK